MIRETGRVVAIDNNYLWLETINRGTCGTCMGEKGVAGKGLGESGCGQSLLARWMQRNNYLKVALDGRKAEDFAVNDEVHIGVPENVVVISSLLVYCLPLMGLIVGAAIGQAMFINDGGAIACALVGLLLGATVVRLYTWMQRHNPHLRPVIIDLIHA